MASERQGIEIPSNQLEIHVLIYLWHRFIEHPSLSLLQPPCFKCAISFLLNFQWIAIIFTRNGKMLTSRKSKHHCGLPRRMNKWTVQGRGESVASEPVSSNRFLRLHFQKAEIAHAAARLSHVKWWLLLESKGHLLQLCTCHSQHAPLTRYHSVLWAIVDTSKLHETWTMENSYYTFLFHSLFNQSLRQVHLENDCETLTA